MRIESVSVGYIGTNCYLACNENMECLIIDPGDEAERIAKKIEEMQVKPLAILLTHGHYDHTGAMNELKERFGINIYCGENEEETLENRRLSLGAHSLKADLFFKDGEKVEMGAFVFKVLETPGHTKGGVCYYFENEGVLFAGDSLFHESVGRTDLHGGAQGDLIRSLKEKIMVLPEETIVYPGHMEATTIGHEKVYNPFLV